MYLQTVMLLLRTEGLHSCPQVMWTMYRKTVSEIVGADDGRVLFCGVAVGFEKEGVPRLRTGRADMAETVSFIGVLILLTTDAKAEFNQLPGSVPKSSPSP
jgi:hypothetical protein